MPSTEPLPFRDDISNEEQTISLFQSLEAIFPRESLGGDQWYLVAISAITFLEPSHASTLYTYLLSQPDHVTPEARKRLIRRLREALVKIVSVIGVCKPLEALFAIVAVEKEEDRDETFSRANWTSGPSNIRKGETWLRQIYQDDLELIVSQFNAHKDFDFITREITYGFYLADMSILGPKETELVVFSAIMVQDLRRLAEWHVRGLERVGVRRQDVEKVVMCVEMVAEWKGVKLGRVSGLVGGGDSEGKGSGI